MAFSWHRYLMGHVVLVYFGYLFFSNFALGSGFYPCHPSKASANEDVKCTRVNLPPDLCSSCDLRPTEPNGEFSDCTNIYDMTSSQCHSALRRYTELNTCDHVRKAAIEFYLDDSNDNSARSVIDYFLYSVCENCCDCLPMGRSRSDYTGLLLTHSASNPTLWKEDRGNCPAHAVYDVCQVLPSVTYFANEGDPDEMAPPACFQLNEWIRSPAASGWQINPETELSDETRNFLRGLLRSSRCSDELIWTRCYDMENSQHHLRLPDGITLPPVTTIATTTTTTATTTTATTTTTTTTTTVTTTAITTTTTATTTTAATTTSGTTATTTISAATISATVDTETAKSPSPLSTIGLTVSTTPTMVLATTHAPENTHPSLTATELPGVSYQSAVSSGESTDSGSPEATFLASRSPQPTKTNNPYVTSDSSSSTTDQSPLTGSCFPGTAIVELDTGARIEMWRLKIGDRVRVSLTEYSPVFVFTHRSADECAQLYLRFETVSNLSIVVTPTHVMHANGYSMAAENINTGDFLLTVSGWQKVRSVQAVSAWGLYNPQTVHGKIVVNNFVVSTFTTALNERLATGLLLPLRALFQSGLLSEKVAGGWWTKGVSVP